ncbi:hypothetical protein NDU88_002777 [Pleurodeles waltl]|uniref:Uncharacterized protein n=1 Tax=Pleurodeles waltl TaxID=8319 RepID=A0AAV7UA85_PLEWA|nr:hypothetical protein NDU88_002777 [Pleurodeles waltl]
MQRVQHLAYFLSDHPLVFEEMDWGGEDKHAQNWRFPMDVLDDVVGGDTLFQSVTGYLQADWGLIGTYTLKWDATKAVVRSEPSTLVAELLELLHQFEEVSPLRINKRKSLVFQLVELACVPGERLLDLGLRWETVQEISTL